MLKKILNKFLKKSDKGQEVQVEPEKILYQSSNRLKGKNAIIIGGGKGIGKAIATRFAEEGAKIIINSRSKTDLDNVKKVLNDIAKSNENVLNQPEPRVRFREFSDYGLKLQLLFWIEKPEERGRTVDSINSQIYKQFSKEKILIPYPTMNVVLPENSK